MTILGISGTANQVYENTYNVTEGTYHDSGAALLVEGRLICAFEEERLNRIKHTNKLPVQAVNKCLKTQGLQLSDIDHISFSQSAGNIETLIKQMGDEYHNITAHQFLKKTLENAFRTRIDANKFEFVEHHFAHAATAFYPSPFEDALALTIDGSGGEYSGSVYEGNTNCLKALKTFSPEKSLGYFYRNVSRILGFGLFDEYKVMGLAPYGNPKTYRNIFKNCYRLLAKGDFELIPYNLHEVAAVYLQRSERKGFTREHYDIAAALQDTLEKIVFHIVRYYKTITGHSKLCLAGGVALNCSLNGKLINSGLFEDVFVYPAASDCGLPVGSALATYFKHCNKPKRYPLTDLFLGGHIGENECILKDLCLWKEYLMYERLKDPSAKAAELIADNKVIGWVQGRSEFAPRALGNRSILADPRPPENKEKINAIVKKREAFRPFAPSVLEEYTGEYFELPGNSNRFPFMMFVLNVQKKYRKHLGAVTHVDGTARVQTVSKEHNPKYWQLIKCFQNITNTPVVLNTSFNNNAEPIVDSANDAIICFLTTHLDYLVIGDFLITKTTLTTEKLAKLKISRPEYIRLVKSESHLWQMENQSKIQFKITNSYNSVEENISPDMFNLLVRSNGRKSIACLINELDIRDTIKKTKLIEECVDLWNKRKIVLTPEEIG